MAEQMQDIKRRIKSVGSTERITSAMKLVSASKLRRARKRLDDSRTGITELYDSLIEVLSMVEHPPRKYTTEGVRKIKRTCYVLFTSSNGLCGSYNTTIIKEFEEMLRNDDTEKVLVTIGSKGKEYFNRRGAEIILTYDEPADNITFEVAKTLALPILEMYGNGELDEINLVYTSYINTLEQKVVCKRVLPLDYEDEDGDGEVIPSNVTASPVTGGSVYHDVEFTPSSDAVFEYVVPKFLELEINYAAIEAATCEHAARHSAMENASSNARDMLSDLQLHYNRARQSDITNEIIEIVAGSEAQH